MTLMYKMQEIEMSKNEEINDWWKQKTQDFGVQQKCLKTDK